MDILGYIATQEPVASMTAQEKQDLMDDFAEAHNYQDTIDGESNPQTKKEFGNVKLREYVKDCVHSVRKRRAEEAATYSEIDV